METDGGRAKETVERSQAETSRTASYVVMVDEQRHENNNLMAALKKAEDQVESDHLQRQQEKTSLLLETEKSRASYVPQLYEQKHQPHACSEEV